MKRYCYDYPRPSLTTDGVIFGFDGNNLFVLLIERKFDPFKGKWAFPGGFVDMDETTDECVKREIAEETGIIINYFLQFHSFSALNRDPRGRTISVAYLSSVQKPSVSPVAGDDAGNVKWFDIKCLPDLAFDHQQVFNKAFVKLKEYLLVTPLIKNFLGDSFALIHFMRLLNSLNIKYPGELLFKKLRSAGMIVNDSSGNFRINEEWYALNAEKSLLEICLFL
ncbi:MAG: NUDIX hydrolase [Bacteroidales bacterium]|nr:NUDIX hydrolase [Bacteroidales bacterium]